MRKNSSLKSLRFLVFLVTLGLAGLTGWTQPTLSTDGILPLGTDAKPGFRWFSYQVGPLGNGLTTQNENSEGALIGLFGGTTVGSNIANLTAAGAQGYFDIRGVINFNGAAGDIGNFTGDTPIPGLPGVTFSGDNIAAECLTYVEFTAPGSYTMGVNSDDGFRVTQGFDRPRQAMIVDAPPAIAGPVGCSLPALPAVLNSAPAGGFGGPLPSTPLTAEVVLADPILAGGPLVNAAAVAGKICVVDRGGGIAFAVKAKNAQDAGAIAVIVVNETQPTFMPIGMGGSNSTVTIPAFMIGKPDGDRIKGALASGPVTMSLGALGGVELGTFNGGRGAADTTFTFTVPEAGLYPLRMLWYNGGGGLNVEWFTVDEFAAKHLLNNSADSASLRAFQGPVVMNWVAFNDHNPGANTAPFVTPYNLWLGPGGSLTNFTSGELLAGEGLPAQVSVSVVGGVSEAGTMLDPNPGTPAANLFSGKITMNNACYLYTLNVAGQTRFTFTGLDPAMLYSLRTTSVRGRESDVADRWTVAGIEGADAFTDFFTTNGATADSAGAYPFDMHSFPGGTLTSGQIAWNSGRNQAAGDILGWDNIAPGADGSFSVVSYQYNGPIPMAPGSASAGAYGYGPECFMLEEAGLLTPVWVTGGPAGTNAIQSLPFTLSVRYTGTAPRFQWYKVGVGPIDGATSPSYTVPVAQLADTGDYYIVLNNSFSSVTSTVVHVEVIEDNTPPTIVSAAGSATFTDITIVFSEGVDQERAMDNSNYSVKDQAGNDLLLNGFGVMLDNKTVLFQTDTQAENTDYIITVNGVADWAQNPIADNTTVRFHTWVFSDCAGVVFDYFDALNTGNNNLDQTLLVDPRYPNHPTATYYTDRFDSRAFFPDDTHEGYGLHATALFVPDVSGDWTFFLRSDDSSRLWLNPAGPSSAGKIEIVRQDGCCNNLADLRSSAYPLVAGQRYWIEAVMKEGTGGDYLEVGAKVGGAVPASNADVISGSMLRRPPTPQGTNQVVITQQPVSQTVDQNGFATFSIAADTQPVPGMSPCYQWQVNGVDILGATGPTYITPSLTLADDGTVYRCVASVIGWKVVSADAVVHVVPDTKPPTVVSVRGSFSLYQVIVKFSELVDSETAADFANYAMSGGIGVGLATLGTNGTTVTLTLDTPLVPGQSYQLSVSGVRDLASTPNEMVAVTVPFPAFVMSRGFAMEELYFNIGAGTLVSDLTGNPKYPNSPDQVNYKSTLEGPVNQYDNYGTRLSGWVKPPTDGEYVFYFCSDDNGQLSLSPDDSPAGLVPVARENSWSASRTWTGPGGTGARGNPPSNISTQILAAAQMYAFEALGKEGGGGDNTGVAWKIPGGPVPYNGSPGIPGPFLYSLADPQGASVTITQQPADVVAVFQETGTPQGVFFDNFEAYAVDSQLHGQGGWKGWDNSAGAGALVADTSAFCGTKAANVTGPSDLVHTFSGVASGRWTFSMKQYIPSSSAGNSYVILLNTYNDGGPYSWSAQNQCNMDTGQIISDNGAGATLPMVKDQWVEWRFEIDLDANTVAEYYNGIFLSGHPWQSGGINALQAVDLYANNAGPVYYDEVSVTPTVDRVFFDNFEAYAVGSQLHGQGGWKGWDNSAGAGALVADTSAFCGTKAVNVTGPSDLVHTFSDAASGRWTFSMKQYIPSSSSGNSYVILLNTYNDGGPYSWSAQIQCNMDTGKIISDNGGGSTIDMVKDQWVEWRFEINLDANTVAEYYNGTLLSVHPWQSGGINALQAVDLYANNAGPVYYDEVSVTREPVPTSATFTVGAKSTYLGLPNSAMTYVWQRNTGAGWGDIFGAYSSTYKLDVTLADSGSQFRSIVYSPAASATSSVATVTIALAPVSIQREGTSVRISWPLNNAGFVLEQSPTLPATTWTAVPPASYQTDATSVYVVVPATTGNMFYRLRK